MNAQWCLGPWQIWPHLNQIQSETAVLELEPRAMEVLLYLCRHGEAVVSRDELINGVWKGAVVTDQAVNRVISLLRKALGDDASQPRYIATISKRGYRLVAPVRQLHAESAAPLAEACRSLDLVPAGGALEPPMLGISAAEPAALVAHLGGTSAAGLLDDPDFFDGAAEPVASHVLASGSAPTRVLSRRIVVLSSGALLALVLVVLLMSGQWQEAPAPRYTRALALTSTAGNERSPAPSPDGRFLVYSHRPRDEGEFRQLQLLDRQTGQIQALTTGRFVDDNPAWSPDGKSLAFHRRGDKRCQLMSLVISDGRADMDSLRELKPCHPDMYNVSLSYGPRGDKLYYTDALAVSEPMRIMELDLVSGQTRAMTNAPDRGRGDYFVQFAWQTGQLFFLRDRHWRECALYSLDVATGKITQHLNLTWPLGALSVSPRGDNVLYRDISGEFRRLTLRSGAVESLPTAMTAGINPVYMSNGRELVFASGQEYDRNIRFLPNPLRPSAKASFRAAIDSSQRDDTPALAPDSQRLAFVSNRSGLPQIWLQERDGTSRQLSRFSAFDFITHLQWSPQGERLLLMRGERLSLLDASTGVEQALPLRGDDLEMPRWSADGLSLYFSSARGGQRQIYRRDLASGAEVQLTRAGGYAPFPSDDGKTLYFTKYQQRGLWSVSPSGGEERLVLPDIVQDFPEQLALGRTGLYFSEVQGEQRVLNYQAFDGGAVQRVAAIKRGLHQRFVVSRDERLIAFESTDENATDLYLLTDLQQP